LWRQKQSNGLMGLMATSPLIKFYGFLCNYQSAVGGIDCVFVRDAAHISSLEFRD